MAEWFAVNIGNIIVLTAVAALIASCIRTVIKDKRSGKGGCGCGCADCAMHGKCHAAKK